MCKEAREFDFLQLLYRVAETLHYSEDPEHVLQEVLNETVAFFGAAAGSISLINPNNNLLDIEAHEGLPEDCLHWKLPLGVGLTGWVAMYQKPALVPDVSLDPRYVKISDDLKSAVVVPLMDLSGALGVLSLESNTLDAFDENDLTKLELLAAQIVRIVSRIWRIVNLKKKCAQLETILRIVGRLSNRFELEGILRDLTLEARSILDCEMCALYLVREPGVLELEVLADQSGILNHTETIRFEESSLGTAALHNKMIEIGNLQTTEEHHFSTLLQHRKLVGMLSTPLSFGNEVIGLLNAYTAEAHRFSNTEKQVFQALSDIGAFAIENTKLYTRIIDSEDSLRSSERLTTLGLLSAEIAHEIRNPLTVIKLLVESLSLDLDLDQDKQRDLEVVLEKIDDLGEIVGRVLNFGKAQNQIFSRWDLNSIVRDSIQLVRFKLKRNRVEVEFDETQEVFVQCNKGQIQQVLLNLFINAEEAMTQGGLIRVRTELDAANRRVNLYFEDSGCGIPEDIKGGIFESFLTGKATGSGLGLAIVKRVLRDHRGDIVLESTSSAGTAFKVWLPQLP